MTTMLNAWAFLFTHAWLYVSNDLWIGHKSRSGFLSGFLTEPL